MKKPGRPTTIKNAKSYTFQLSEAHHKKLETRARKQKETKAEILREIVQAFFWGAKW